MMAKAPQWILMLRLSWHGKNYFFSIQLKHNMYTFARCDSRSWTRVWMNRLERSVRRKTQCIYHLSLWLCQHLVTGVLIAKSFRVWIHFNLKRRIRSVGHKPKVWSNFHVKRAIEHSRWLVSHFTAHTSSWGWLPLVFFLEIESDASHISKTYNRKCDKHIVEVCHRDIGQKAFFRDTCDNNKKKTFVFSFKHLHFSSFISCVITSPKKNNKSTHSMSFMSFTSFHAESSIRSCTH